MAKKSVNKHCVLTPVKVLPWQIGERNVNDLKRKIFIIEKENIKGRGDSVQKHGDGNKGKSETKIVKRKMEGQKLEEIRGCEREAEIKIKQNKIFLKGTSLLGEKGQKITN